MHAPRWFWMAGLVPLLVFPGILSAQTVSEQELTVEHADCPFFGPQRERFVTEGVRKSLGMKSPHELSSMTAAVGKMLGYVPGGSRTYNYDQSHAAGSIDSYIFADFQAQGITPAPKTTDWEFIRRVTLDLTGRIPTPDRVLSFVADTSSGQARAAGRRTARQTRVGGQVDHVLRRSVQEHRPTRPARA